MRRTFLAALFVISTGAPLAAADTWSTAYKRGDYATAATLLQRAVFEPAEGRAPDPLATRQLALLYADGKGVERDLVMACGLLRAHAAAAAELPGATRASRRDAAAIAERHCAMVATTQRAAAAAATACPRIGLKRGTTMTLEPGWAIQFNDRSATVARYGETREQPLGGGPLCRVQVLRLRHTPLATAGGSLRHVVELVTVQSAWRRGALTREIVWQLYEVRGLALDLAAVQRWEAPGSAWPAPPLPDALARGAMFEVRDSGEIDYSIEDAAGPRQPFRREKIGRSLAAVSGSSSGSTRVRPTTVMKLVSPFQRGTTCRCT